MTHVQSQPRGFSPLFEQDLFTDIHGVTPSPDLNPEAPRSNICRLCAAEVLLWGLREWWVRERQKGFLEETVTRRRDCPEGSGCERQRDLCT
jgi:E3 ubiquitin-protein ligase CHFR